MAIACRLRIRAQSVHPPNGRNAMDAMSMSARPPNATRPATLDHANKTAHLRAGPLISAGGSPIEALGSASTAA